MTVATLPQIQAQLDAMLGRDAQARVVAIHAEQKLPWPDAVGRAGRRFRLRWCPSTLALREALAEDDDAGAPPGEGLVLLTPLPGFDLPDDVASRIARGRIHQPEGWAMVRTLFGAKAQDARLGRLAWMPPLLIDLARDGYAPVAHGFLDQDTAWQAVLARALGLHAARPDACSLLAWTLTPASPSALNGLPAVARPDILQWLADAAGPAGRMAVACIAAGRSADAVPLGLVCDLVFSAEADGHGDIGAARYRLERYTGDVQVSLAEGRDWAAAAVDVVRQDLEAHAGALDRAQALLRELGILAHAGLSAWLPAGLDARLDALARAIDAWLDRPVDATLAAVDAAAAQALVHHGLDDQPQRAEPVQMAVRLVRWLARPQPALRDVGDAALWQADEGAFVDWARFRLLGVDVSPALAAALARLRAQALARREAIARQLAGRLPDWVAAEAALPPRLLPVEQVLSRVVAPLAAQHPVLVLVVDGLSTSIFRELFDRPLRHGWTECVPTALPQPLAAVAMLPTVTEVSRASLLCGRRMLGTQAQEKPGFATQPDLVARSEPSLPPRLFHKGELAMDGQLAPDLRAALADARQHVVGVVYNAVDDHLKGSDQLHQRWSPDHLRLLLPLLREAREARRVLVVTADHGHVLDDGTRALPHGTGQRWRGTQVPASDDEVLLRGPRVLHPEGGQAVVCLWGERTRYGNRCTGYHGGVAAQELVVPLSVLVPVGVALTDWTPAPPVQPPWWDLTDRTVAAPATAQGPAARVVAPATRPARRKAPTAPAVPAAQPALFTPDEMPTAAPVAPPVAADWIGALLASPVYAAQRRLAARVALPDERMRSLLQALEERGGRIGRTALAQRLAEPELRLGGMLSVARRVLNVDQSEVLGVNPDDQSVVLNRALLLRQFGLGSLTSSDGGP